MTKVKFPKPKGFKKEMLRMNEFLRLIHAYGTIHNLDIRRELNIGWGTYVRLKEDVEDMHSEMVEYNPETKEWTSLKPKEEEKIEEKPAVEESA